MEKDKKYIEIPIRIIGTRYDVNLLKRILKSYLHVATTQRERYSIECYLSLIDYAVRRAEAAQ